MVKASPVLITIVPRIGPIFKGFSTQPDGWGGPDRGRTPQLGRAFRIYLAAGVLVAVLGSPDGARAEPPIPGPKLVLAIGPVGAADYSEGNWDSLFGAETALLRHRPAARVRTFGVTVGGTRLAERSGGRLWGEVIASAAAGPVELGLTAGPVVALDRFRRPRYGAQIGFFVYAGITPYARLGSMEKNGQFVEMGVRIPLPALTW